MLGLIPAFIAWRKHRAFLPWWIYGTALFPAVLPHAILLRALNRGKQEEERAAKKQCPYCREWLPWEDDVCPSCRLRLFVTGIDGPQHLPPS
jgi:hypothetical protein